MAAMIPVAEALARIVAGCARPTGPEDVPLEKAWGRTLAADIVARRAQPPFAASAMDGYAVRAADVASVPAVLRRVGESAAGSGYGGSVGPGEAARIFTGAPLPEGADTIAIQENTTAEGDAVTVSESVAAGRHIRAAGLDFADGEILMREGERLDAGRLALAAAGGHAVLPVRRRPRVAILATGDELVRPGESARPDQIVCSNPYAVAAIVARAGGEPVDLGIARDTMEDLSAHIDRALEEKADLLITLGGASVGEHDLVQPALVSRGMELGFWRVALRPGKPLMHGTLRRPDGGDTVLVGLPGNPVSSVVCSILFVAPAIRALVGDPTAGEDESERATLGAPLRANDIRQDYMRASLTRGPDGELVATAQERQDSSMLSVLSRSEGLIVRPPHAPAAAIGDPCRVIRFDRFC